MPLARAKFWPRKCDVPAWIALRSCTIASIDSVCTAPGKRSLSDFVPVFTGEKSESERFPGAVQTLSIEAMVQDRRAIQAGTSHFLGQNFARASGIQFQNRQGKQEFGWTTS